MPANACSLWAVHSFGDDAFDRFHIKSSRLHPASYPGLAELTGAEFTYAISFHVKKHADRIEVGGLAEREFRDQVAAVIEDAVDTTWETTTDHEEGKFMATTEQNVVNWLTEDSASGAVRESLKPPAESTG